MKKILKIFKILINIIIYFFIAVLAIYLLIVGYQKYIKKSNLIKINDYYLFQIASGSMEKNYHIGDCIVAKKQDDYKVGDVITYELDGFYITHRVHKIENDKIITKGDANKTLDDAINKYTEAMKLSRECSNKLTEVTEKVNKILSDNGTLEDFEVNE